MGRGVGGGVQGRRGMGEGRTSKTLQLQMLKVCPAVLGGMGMSRAFTPFFSLHTHPSSILLVSTPSHIPLCWVGLCGWKCEGGWWEFREGGGWGRGEPVKVTL